MYNSCSISSSAFSLRSNGSISFSFNDCSSNVFNSSPLSSSPCFSSCCSSCACCCATFATATHRLPSTPCFLYGLRQSALVHCSPSRRFILPAGCRCLSGFLSCDLNRAAFEVSTGIMFARKAKGRFRCMVSEDNAASSRYLLGGVDAAEAMVNLLSEEVDGECLGTGEINRSSYKVVEVNKAKDYDKGDDEPYREKTRTVRSGLLESDSKDEYEPIAVESRGVIRRKAESESSLRTEHLRGRTKSSSCSSYYSLSSSGDLESDVELSDREQFVTETIRDETRRSEGQLTEGLKRGNAVGISVDWDLKKNQRRGLLKYPLTKYNLGQNPHKNMKEGKSQGVREMSKIHVSDVGKTSQEKLEIEEEDRNLVQSRSRLKMKIWEEDTIMDQTSFQQTRKKQLQRGEWITGQLEMRRKSECSSETNEAKNKKTSILQSRTQKMKQNDTSSLNFTSDQKQYRRVEPGKGMPAITNINERSEMHNEANGRVQQKKSRKENLKSTSVSEELSSGQSEEGSSFQAFLSLVSETREQQSHVNLEESEKRSTEYVLMPPHPQAITGGLPHDDSISRIFTEEASGKTSEVALPPHTCIREEGLHLHTTNHMQEKRGNISSDLTSPCEGDKYEPNASGQYDKEESKMKRHDSRQSLKGSGGRGPSNEMWDVTDPSVQEPLEAETPQGISTSGNASIKRSGMSLWTLMGDIVRLQWSSRALTPNSSSTARSGGRTSPNESVHSEGDFSDSTRTTEKVGHLEGNISPSSNILETVPASEVISLTSQKEKHGISSSEVAPSGKEVVQSSLPLPAGSTKASLVLEDISEADKINIKGSGSIRTMVQQPFGARIAEASGSQDKEGELKQRKLQRTKQVPRDRFDEWEEAYRLEREQRKIDEMFMRETLLEAKKAADYWEVLVGAVLVQHGKIIARGRNLVEELRDSTAHAEMICIQEASSILRSWRLADTTLYVTLEPCPMCAGAILQARIDTVGWGAPNKLLGADGSWIRLFPDGRGGNGSEVTDKTAARVHPFHPNMGIRQDIGIGVCRHDATIFPA
ncbi:TRNA arginine adenosine deaminase, putative isoform 2 [Hibiscus syriacus]|uniref:tRNA arginine adenosine deaminase, putative isoform 2 n=1 Tax=Hibiscus syriacus TaxID=106335 RepID=A0A6A2Y629_HIBSY|nr:TRNA arginine adenosine deaminase, putative isoform 2 [Hibiscus syriacus]